MTKAKPTKTKPRLELSDLQPLSRDFAFLMDRAAPAGDLLRAVLAADKALIKQFSGYPQALGMASAVMFVLAMLPGIPTIPFLALSSGAAALPRKVRLRMGLCGMIYVLSQ